MRNLTKCSAWTNGYPHFLMSLSRIYKSYYMVIVPSFLNSTHPFPKIRDVTKWKSGAFPMMTTRTRLAYNRPFITSSKHFRITRSWCLGYKPQKIISHGLTSLQRSRNENITCKILKYFRKYFSQQQHQVSTWWSMVVLEAKKNSKLKWNNLSDKRLILFFLQKCQHNVLK